VEEYLNNNKQNEIFWRLLADPAEDGRSYASELGRLVNDFPQSGLLQALLAHAGNAQNVGHASAYLNPKTLYVLKNAPETLAGVMSSQIIQHLSDNEHQAASPGRQDELREALITREKEIAEPAAGEPAGMEPENSFIEDAMVISSTADEPEIAASGAEVMSQSTEYPGYIHADEQLTETPTFELAQEPHSIDEEVYDEIVGIEDIQIPPVAKAGAGADAPRGEDQPEKLPQEAVLSAREPLKERSLNMDDEAEKLIVGNIAATDYFVFDRAFTERKQPEAAENAAAREDNAAADEAAAETPLINPSHEVSKYDDDTLPYTFMWWLNKTRREHAGVYQPFKLDTTLAIRQHASDELQQQYYENIFHVSSVEELERGASGPALEFDPKKKEDRIIKKFITEEPHIGTPSADKLDTENKAKRSSEDQDVLVTETLARIYTDQMLYHKAIHTYKKLMLKYPEKSRYFADQIEQLERKTN
jgi:hypothetical protein